MPRGNGFLIHHFLFYSLCRLMSFIACFENGIA